MRSLLAKFEEYVVLMHIHRKDWLRFGQKLGEERYYSSLVCIFFDEDV